MESGVRSLDRAIGSVCRQVAYNYAVSADMKTFQKVTVDDELIKEALGNSKYDFKLNEKITKPGIAIVRIFIFLNIFRDWHIQRSVEKHFLLNPRSSPEQGIFASLVNLAM
jgi:hypothetical protein